MARTVAWSARYSMLLFDESDLTCFSSYKVFPCQLPTHLLIYSFYRTSHALDSSTSHPMFTRRTGPFFQGIFAISTGLSKLEFAHCCKLSSSFFSSSTFACFELVLFLTAEALYYIGGFLFSTKFVPPLVSKCCCGVVPELPSIPISCSMSATPVDIFVLESLRCATMGDFSTRAACSSSICRLI